MYGHQKKAIAPFKDSLPFPPSFNVNKNGERKIDQDQEERPSMLIVDNRWDSGRKFTFHHGELNKGIKIARK